MIETLAYFCLFWMASGLLALIIALIADATMGKERDGEILLGIAICLGMGPIVLVMVLKGLFEDYAENQRAKRQRHYPRS
jgi:hypothetical protein